MAGSFEFFIDYIFRDDAEENRDRTKNDLEQPGFGAGKLFVAENYLEAVGITAGLKAGVALLEF
ncbi:unnamed protein product [marine sediment metagenome]|uniref:Uncharacterized protein n=1 Tax=marine sediment metagenome TaxID=412755 RepID=X0RYD4_9ZZZZ